jgi:hypothetical protein
VLASRGELSEAEALARRSVELARGYLGMFVGWLLDAADVFRLAGLEHEARSTTEERPSLSTSGPATSSWPSAPGSVSLPRRKPTRPTWRNARRLGCYARPALWSWA